MKNQESLAKGLFTLAIFVCLLTAVSAQTATDGKLATVTGSGSSVRWDVAVSNAGASLIISAPDGRIFSREFRGGVAPEISLSDRQLEKLPDGVYSYELRLRPVLSVAEREALKAARGRDDEPEAERAARRRPAVPQLTQSGSFSILNGVIVVGGAEEAQRSNAKSASQIRTNAFMARNPMARLGNHHFTSTARPDDVIADDLIVQGSACIGLDCVNNESFGFDTIRLKENNTRISFNDTSTSAGFPTNDWTIRANSSANGGANFLAFVDRGTSENGDETGTIVFEVDAGASANALKVASSSKVGLRTATPVLDLHITTTDTPAHRLEQTNGGGFTAQTWDIAGNEANFFVRDVTGGSRLPFRIRPGAPTSSVDISASGSVGVGTASPTSAESFSRLTVEASDATAHLASIINDGAGQAGLVLRRTGGTAQRWFEYIPSNSTDLRFFAAADVMTIQSGGNVGIGTSAPDLKLSVSGDADKSVGGGSWQFFSDERLKNIKGRFNSGLKAVMQLQPIRFQYKRDNALGLQSEIEQVGFGAQALQKIIPEAVSKNANGYLMVNNDPILWTMLNAIKEQQNEIVQLKQEVQKLRATHGTRRHGRR